MSEFTNEVWDRVFSHVEIFEYEEKGRWNWAPIVEMWGDGDDPSESEMNGGGAGFDSWIKARSMALGWIKRNRQDIVSYCENETKEAIAYRKSLSPSDMCKQAGLKGLKELSDITGVSEQTLINWRKDKTKLFRVVLAGAVSLKA